MQYGDPDGHGTYECGAERQFLGRHVREHGMTAAQYREAHGLGRTATLASKELRKRWGEKATARVGSPEWGRFEAARDPDSAREESLRVLAAEPTRAQVAVAHRKAALKASRSRPKRVCEVDGCGRKHVADGLCRTHYERRKRTGDVQADVPVRPRKGGPRPYGDGPPQRST